MVKRHLSLAGVVWFSVMASAMAQEYVPDELIVKFKAKSFHSAQDQVLGKLSGKVSLKGSIPGLGMSKMGLKAGQNLEAVIQELSREPNVDYVEKNYIVRIVDFKEEGVVRELSEIEEQNQSASSYSGFSYSDSTSFWQHTDTNTRVRQTWDHLTPLASNTFKPIVAVIDTGVAWDHNVFVDAQAIWTNPGEIAGNGVDDDGNGFVDDVRGWNFRNGNNSPYDDGKHGTHVAGIVLGAGQNIFASPMSEAKVRIMPLKFLGSDGSGTTADAVAAIYYAVNNGAAVINNSWGGSSYSQSLHDAMKYAYDNQVVLVSAAGNYSSNNDTAAMYPANYPVPSHISVAATNSGGYLLSFSNYGASTVHLGAPGSAIDSTVPSSSKNSFQYMSGTSMAAPLVAGLAGLMIREAPNLSGYQIRELIQNAGTLITGSSTALSGKTTTGRLVNLETAVLTVKTEIHTSSFQPSYVASSIDRGVASVEESSSGCGTVSSLVALQNGGEGPFPPGALLFLIGLTLLPLVIVLMLREKSDSKNRRRFDRFVMNSDIRIKVGERELTGHMKTISLGGASFEADTLLEKGGIVTLQISSPDGVEQVQVGGHIVWNEQNQKYGVQFDDVKTGVMDSIRHWTKRLARAA